jgi:hypothetical protein
MTNCIGLTRRADGVAVHVNFAHIVVISPRANDPDSPAVVSLSTGNQLDVEETVEEILRRINYLHQRDASAASGW